jgi:hypothetical protein
MAHPLERDWMIVAPWWQWIDPASVPPGTAVSPDPQVGRLTKPVFQKYDSPKLVNDFIKDPQKSLKFVVDDLVHAVQNVPGPSVSKAGRLFRIGASIKPDNSVIDQQYVPDGTNTRKVFLTTHKRFYLVVCSVHCDGPGFPKAARQKVCQAGFVVRRRTLSPSTCGLDEVKPILRQLTTSRARLSRVNQLTELETSALAASTGVNGYTPSAKLESLLRTRTSLRALVAEERTRFDEWVTRFKVVPELQGWFPSTSGLDKIGCWKQIDEMPADLGGESSFPLYPLIPDQNDRKHAGQFGTIFFGVLPTSSHDCDPRGGARFDDREYYEVRCWVRRHKVPHDPDRPCPCPDGVFWSLPSRPYRLASHYDLVGTGNQPVTIQLPDLNELAAQSRPTLGVGLAKPPGSLMVSGTQSGQPINKGRSTKFEICFLPIPLITIVATFVLELFLPVVVLLFQLWWMLALKFCIPPELNLAAGITGEIGIDGDLNVDASLEAGINVADLTNALNASFGSTVTTNLTNTYSPIALANMDFNVSRASAGGAAAPSPAAGLEFEVEVTHV